MAGSSELQALQVQRVVSGLVAGTNWGQDFIAERVLPPIDTGSENFAYSKWGNEGMRNVETRRGIDAEPNKVRIASGTAEGQLEEHTLQTYYDYRRLKAAEEAGNGDLFRAQHAQAISQLVQIQKEKQVADILFTSANYGSNTAADVDFAAAGIRDAILAVKDSRQQATGVRLGKLVVGQTTHRLLLKNPDIIDTIKYTRGGFTTAQIIAEYLELDEYLVGSAVYQAAAANGAAGSATALWTADCAALVATGAGNLNSPAFAKLFTMNVPASGSRSYVRTWVPDPGLLEHMLYSEFFKAATVFTEAGYLWTDTADAA